MRSLAFRSAGGLWHARRPASQGVDMRQATWRPPPSCAVLLQARKAQAAVHDLQKELSEALGQLKATKVGVRWWAGYRHESTKGSERLPRDWESMAALQGCHLALMRAHARCAAFHCG